MASKKGETVVRHKDLLQEPTIKTEIPGAIAD
jgi:hypothetical protein